MKKNLHLLGVKKIYVIVTIIAVLVVALIIFTRPQAKNTLYTVTKGDIVNTLLINGTYTTASQVPVNSPADGIITTVFVKNGDQVKKNDPLFHVDSTATEQEKAAAYTNYLTASSALSTDNAALFSLQSTMFAAWKKYTDLSTNSTYQNSDSSPKTGNRVLPEFTTTQDDWLAAEASYKNQQTIIAKDQAAVSSALLAYNATQNITVNAPAGGTIVNFQKKSGDQIQSTQTSILLQSLSGQTATTIAPVLIISDLSNPVLTAAVDQVNIPRIKIGQKGAIVFDALPKQTFNGVVSTLDTIGTKTQGTTTYTVGMTITDASADLLPNMTASVTLETLRKQGVVTVPNSALIEKGGKTFVQKNGAKADQLTQIKIGATGLTQTEVVSGLSVGDSILESK